MIKEKRYRYVKENKEISGGVYTNKEGKIIMQSRYERDLNWFERLWRELFASVEGDKDG